jgi:hypothetical protein
VIWTPPAEPEEDPTETVLFAIRNANSNVVGLTDDQGEPAAWFEYTPYGELALAQAGSSSQSALALSSRVGHQGLFFDNLDQPWVADQLALDGNGKPLAGMYHNRNRTYLPKLGRFAQRDPNASGMLSVSLWHSGLQPSQAAFPEVDASCMYANGVSLHQYVGSAPTARRDPTGLDWGLTGQIAVMGIQSYLDASGTMQEALDGVSTVLGIRAFFQNAAFVQEQDVDWALDWTSSDDYFSAQYSDDPQATENTKGPTMAGLHGRRPSKVIRIAGAKGSTYRSAFWSKNYSRKGDAFEAAKKLCKGGNAPVLHPGHRRGEWPHYQPVDAAGKVIPWPHFRFPPRQH